MGTGLGERTDRTFRSLWMGQRRFGWTVEQEDQGWAATRREYIWIWIFSLGSQPVSSKMTSTHRDPDVKWYRGFMHAHSRQLQIRQQHQAAAICSATNSGNSAWSASASCSTSSATACTLLSHLRVSFPTSTSARPLPFSPDASRPSK